MPSKPDMNTREGRQRYLDDTYGKTIGSGNGGMPDGTGLQYGNQPAPLQLGNDEPLSIRGAMAPWKGSLESFNEWKQAKVSGQPTEWGRVAQHNYEMRKFPDLQLPQFTPEEYEQRVQERAANRGYNSPAISALLKLKGSR